MAFFQLLPLSPVALLVISVVVCAGATLQSATGVGLGLLAGPILVLYLPIENAIFVAIVLNLLLSVVLLPRERGEIALKPLRVLLIGTLVGIPAGWLVLQQVGAPLLKVVCGGVVLAAAVQLQLLTRRPADIETHEERNSHVLVVGGMLSGFMSGCLAVPGPAALWALLRHHHAPHHVRATLRALFVLSYGVACVVHVGLGGLPGEGLYMVAALLPALVIGLAFGETAKRRLGNATLGAIFRLLLVAMGFTLLWKGMIDVSS